MCCYLFILAIFPFRYIQYWRNKFKNSPFEQIIPSLSLDSAGQKYFLMSVLLKEDKELRHHLKLEYALRVQEFERNDKSFSRQCLFCRLIIEGSFIIIASKGVF